jgi:secondary thiamine-phosphate synthase enzyme
MSVETHRVTLESRGHTHVLDLTHRVEERLAQGKIRDGIVTVFVIGSTAAITATEFEPGLATSDLREAYERIAPERAHYKHHETWNDDNGHSHVRATVTGPSLTVPLVEGKMTLGTWQQIVLLDFDTRPRRREIVVQVIGE